MPRIDITIEVCGMAGDGTIAAGGLINEAMSMGGFSVLGFDSYPAEIRGFGRCVTRSRIGNESIVALADLTHVLISLDDVQSLSRAPFLRPDACVVFDNNPPEFVEESKSLIAQLDPNVCHYGAPLFDLANAAAGSSRGRNLVGLGVFAGIYGADLELFRKVVTKKFQGKGEKVLRGNLKCLEAGFRYAEEQFSDRLRPIFKDFAMPAGDARVMITGNEAIGKAALDAGLKLYFGYPITPATPIMEFLAKHLPSRGGRVVQMEDEIASIGAVIGAYYAGARAMTATSGPGFALMTELITHAVMSEIPAVIFDAQRGGPSTGLPTKTEQSDLHAAVYGGPGDSARIVIAPANVQECYDFSVKSFQLAEKYQTPVIVLTDFYLDARMENLPVPHAAPAQLADATVYAAAGAEPFHRYANTDSGISPRSIPGMEGLNYVATGLEHTPKGSPDYTAEIHTLMTEKRYRKIWGALADLPAPVEYSEGGRLDVGVIGWGSTFGSIQEAAHMAREKGIRAGALKISSIYPYHADIISEFMSRCEETLFAELNFSGQLANLVGSLNRKPPHRLNQITGAPMSPSAILERIEQIVGADAK